MNYLSTHTFTFIFPGRMVITGGSEGLIAVSSPTTGMTVRVISDHKGAPITNIDVSVCQEQELSVSAPQLWLATSADRRVSVWSADWSKDFCELVDWLTFPAPAFTPDGTVIAKQDQKVICYFLIEKVFFLNSNMININILGPVCYSFLWPMGFIHCLRLYRPMSNLQSNSTN